MFFEDVIFCLYFRIFVYKYFLHDYEKIIQEFRPKILKNRLEA